MTLSFIFYTDCCVLGKFAATAYGPVVFIRPKYRDDLALRQHELVHVHQFWRSLGINSLLYLLSKKHRLRLEIEAYAVQAWRHPERIGYYAKQIATLYRLDVSQDVVEDKLRAYLKTR